MTSHTQIAAINPVVPKGDIRHDWEIEEIEALFAQPFNDLVFQAQTIHRTYFDPNEIQISTLLSIKTGGCPEDCHYCPQSARYNTGVKADKLMEVDDVVKAAKAAKEAGASRFCMGAAWRNPKDRDLPALTEMVKEIKALGLESCMTLGMLTQTQADALSDAGLDYYNHNIDTSEDFYGDIISTREFQDRLDTLEHVRKADIHVCSGGIVGLGENVTQRAAMLHTLANLTEHPKSVPINLLVQVEGTPVTELEAPDPLDFIRMIAVARILMPASHVRLSAGRETMSDENASPVLLAGANSIFYGETLLTTPNPDTSKDQALFKRLGLTPSSQNAHA